VSGYDHDLRDLRGRIFRVVISIILGFGSMLGVVGLSYQIVLRYDRDGIFDPATMIVGITVAAVAWCAALHWWSRRSDRVRPTSARVIRRRGRVSRATT
jgi:hypothetical protein